MRYVTLLALAFVSGCFGGSDDTWTFDDPDDDTDRDTLGDESGCQSDAECGVWEICWDECEPALDRSYNIVIWSIDADTVDADGQYWDVAGGAPDFGVEWGTLNSAGEFISSCYELAPVDSFSGSISESCAFTLASGGRFAVYIWEEDLTGYAWVHGWEWNNNDQLTGLARAADGARFDLEAPDVTLSISVQANY